MESFNLLLVEDERAELDRLDRVFTRAFPNCRIIKAASPTAATNQFRKWKPEVVILDLGLGGYGPQSGLELITRMVGIDSSARIITLTGHTSEEIGLAAIRNGAASFLTKPANMVVLEALVRDYAQTAKFKRNAVERESVEPIPGFIGNSASMKNVYRLVRQCAATITNVLIVGETGTGKELVAKAIHDLGPRREQPFSVYFGSVPASMAESELFGYVRGAFTGALAQGTDGCIKRANRGTLFIDELCSLDLDIQRKLLRAIEEKSFKPLGADAYQHSDFRLVCAAQPRIYDFVRIGHVREDLLSRVEVITIKLPPLRERREDILPLAEFFLRSTKEELRESGVVSQVQGFAPDALQAFREYAWPRNLRQLKHTVHNGLIQAQLRGAEQITLLDVVSRLEEDGASSRNQGAPRKVGVTLREAVSELEREMITESLKRNNNAIALASLDLGVGRTTLWRKIKEYNLAGSS